MASRLGWVDQHDRQHRAMLGVVELFKDERTVDELGIGSIRDALADALVPGTSVLLTCARYLLMIPWQMQHVTATTARPSEASARLHQLCVGVRPPSRRRGSRGACCSRPPMGGPRGGRTHNDPTTRGSRRRSATPATTSPDAAHATVRLVGRCEPGSARRAGRPASSLKLRRSGAVRPSRCRKRVACLRLMDKTADAVGRWLRSRTEVGSERRETAPAWDSPCRGMSPFGAAAGLDLSALDEGQRSDCADGQGRERHSRHVRPAFGHRCATTTWLAQWATRTAFSPAVLGHSRSSPASPARAT